MSAKDLSIVTTHVVSKMKDDQIRSLLNTFSKDELIDMYVESIVTLHRKLPTG